MPASSLRRRPETTCTLALLLTLAFAACGGGGAGTSGSDTASSSASSNTAGSSAASSRSASSATSSVSASSTASSAQASSVAGSCSTLESRIRISQASLPALAAPSDEYTPVILSADGNGGAGSLIAWKEKSASQIRVGRLAADDKQFSSLLSLGGDEVHSLLGHSDGGGALMLVSDDPDIYSSKYCKGSSTPANAACQKMQLVRFGSSGSVVFNTTLTDKANVDSEGALFIWWYGHTGRLGWDGSRYAAYFRSAGSYARPNVAGEIDIHAGDTLRMVDASGNRLASGGWQWGCSHSWSIRLAGNSSGWASFCHGDAYPNAMRLQLLGSTGTSGKTTEWLSGSDATTRALGGVVSDASGYWLSYLETTSGTLRLHLARFANNGSMSSDQIVSDATGIDATYPFRPWLARLGSQLLLGWKSGGKLMLQVADSTGTPLGSPVPSSAAISNFDEFVTLANGDVAFANAGSAGSVSVSRVQACN